MRAGPAKTKQRVGFTIPRYRIIGANTKRALSDLQCFSTVM